MISCIIPWLMLLRHSWQTPPDQDTLGRVLRSLDECWHSWWVATLAILIGMAIYLMYRSLHRRLRCIMMAFILLLASIGLFGALPLGLSIHHMVLQWPILHGIYDTNGPWLIGLLLIASPWLLLSLFLFARGGQVPAFLARKLMVSSGRRSRRQGWGIYSHLRLAPLIGLCLAVQIFLMFELLLSSLLHPVGRTPITHLLYNQMHFQATQMLSAQIVLAMSFAILMSCLMYGVCRLLTIGFGHLQSRWV